MVMASLMMEFTGEEVLTQCLTMGPYLMGLGLGSLFGDRVKEEHYLSWLWRFEWTSVVFLPLTPVIQLSGIFFLINFSVATSPLELKSTVYILLGLNALLGFFGGILGGAQLPLIMKKMPELREERLLALNYLGPLLAGITIVQMSSHAVSLSVQIYFIGIVELLGLSFLAFSEKQKTKPLLQLGFALCILIMVTHFFPKLEEITVKSAYMKTKLTSEDLWSPGNFLKVIHHYGSVERVRTPYQTIDLYLQPPELSYAIPGNATVFLNRKPQFDLFSVTLYHQTMVYAGLNLLQATPKNILILGAGDGLLLRELRDIPGILNVTMVELDEKMLEWSKRNPVVSQLNQGIFDHLPNNMKVLVGDGVSYLRNNLSQKYDLILVDFPFPNGNDLAKLYSFEFYRLVRRSLSDTGVVIIDLPLYLTPKKVLSPESLTIVKTMKAAGLGSELLFGPQASFIAFSPGKKVLEFDYEKFPKHLHLSTYQNLVAPFREKNLDPEIWKKTPINTMFWPRGL